MIYLLALIGLVAMTVVVWRAFGPEAGPSGGGRVTGPDDDPDFLRGIDTGTARRGPADDSGDEPTEPPGPAALT